MKPSLLLTTNRMPWDFCPLRGIIWAFAYLGSIILFLAMFPAVICALTFPFAAFSETRVSPSVLKTIGNVGLWLLIVGSCCALIAAFAALNRRLDVSRYLR